MSRILLLFLIIFSTEIVFSQSTEQTAKAVAYSFKVVPGKNYLISASPAGTEDAVIAIGVNPSKPMLIVNSGGNGISESYKVQAVGNEIQVAVYLNARDAKHTLAVIDEDQQFPYLRWRSDSSVRLETAPDGFIMAFKFSWLNHYPVQSRATGGSRQNQSVAADSAVAYKFDVKPGVPLDVLLVPETNHLDLALVIVNKDDTTSSDNNRSFENVRLTEQGQVEWTQVTPLDSKIEIIVADKSGFGGKYGLAVRPLNQTGSALEPSDWSLLDSVATRLKLWNLYSKYPLVTGMDAAVYEFLPTRLENNYTFQASSLDTGLNFFLVIRADKASPPFVIRSGGDSRRTAAFSWSYVDGKLVFDDQSGRKRYYFEGFPTRAKMQISVVSAEGSGRISGALYETNTLRELEMPAAGSVGNATVFSSLTADYEGFERIDNDLLLYRFNAVKGNIYKVRISPNAFFDAGIVDPSKRHFDNPTALELTDKAGTGAVEDLTVTAKEDFIEFGVIGIRYAHGLVRTGNKRIGGEGFLSVAVTDEDGVIPELRETVRVTLPNDVVSKELGLEHQPRDPLAIVTASRFPPYPTAFDRRIVDSIKF